MESGVPVTLASLETGSLSWKGSLQVGVASSAPPVRGWRAALPCPPAQEFLGQPQRGKAAALQPPGAKPQEPRGNSCGEHLAELEYAVFSRDGNSHHPRNHVSFRQSPSAGPMCISRALVFLACSFSMVLQQSAN